MGDAFLCVVRRCLVPSLPGSLYCKGTWKSKAGLLFRMETVPVITDSCEVQEAGDGGACVHGGEEPGKGVVT